MSAPRKGLAAVVLWLNVLATPLLLFMLAGLWLYRKRVFVIGNPLTAVELTMLVSFASILLFNLVSVFWLSRFRFENGREKRIDFRLFGLGLLCLVLMAAQKVMVDEVAHETVGAWNIQGEYLMLYGMLMLQLIYNLLVGGRLCRLFRQNEPLSTRSTQSVDFTSAIGDQGQHVGGASGQI